VKISNRQALLIIFVIALVIGFYSWRRKAPSWSGQDLHANLELIESKDNPGKPGQDLELLMVGDMGSGDKNQAAIAAAMNTYCQTHPLVAIIFLGDNFYPKGVASPDDPQWQSKFIEPYGTDCLGKLPFYAMLGNHDYKGNPSAQIAYRGHSPAWHMPHRFYDLRVGKLLQLTVIDTNLLDICGFDQFCTIDFMLASLAKSEATYTIVTGHHPIASASGKYSQTMQGKILESLLCDRARYYVAGHSHHLEHRTSAHCPLDLFIVGGGGASLYETKKDQKTSKFVKSSFGFLSVKANPDHLTFAFYDEHLEKLYSVQHAAGEAAGSGGE